MSLRYLKVFRSFRAIDDLDGDRAQIHQIIGLFHFRIGSSTERLLENDLRARQNGPIRVASALVHLAGRRVFVDLLLGLVLVCGQLGHQHAVVCCANDNIVVVHVDDNSTYITDLVHSRISVCLLLTIFLPTSFVFFFFFFFKHTRKQKQLLLQFNHLFALFFSSLSLIKNSLFQFI